MPHAEEALRYVPAVPEDQHERVRRAAVACPVQAIIVVLGVAQADGARA
ncbi:ferredoxin [Actinacidiphila sp. bgisy160]